MRFIQFQSNGPVIEARVVCEGNTCWVLPHHRINLSSQTNNVRTVPSEFLAQILKSEWGYKWKFFVLMVDFGFHPQSRTICGPLTVRLISFASWAVFLPMEVLFSLEAIFWKNDTFAANPRAKKFHVNENRNNDWIPINDVKKWFFRHNNMRCNKNKWKCSKIPKKRNLHQQCTKRKAPMV